MRRSAGLSTVVGLALLGSCGAFLPGSPAAPAVARPSALAATKVLLDPELTKTYPRDFKNIPVGTSYGTGLDAELNRAIEADNLVHLEAQLQAVLKKTAEIKKRPVFTTALIAGDCVILDAIHKAGLLSKIDVLFIDTFFLFPETLDFLREVENHYGFKAKMYHCSDCATQEDFYDKYGADYWMEDIEQYDFKCKVEPLQRALKESNTDAWINGRRRDHGAERASLPVWEADKVNPLAFWTFEDCWNYLRKYQAPYHPLHDVGFSSLGDMQSTAKVPLEKWFTYAGERSGRFQGMTNKDGSAKTECGIHTKK
jgi:phosphoadenosine phosphosulfate reductase